MLKITIESFKNLSDEEKENVSNNGYGKEYASYIRVTYQSAQIALESDAMEPEDATFYRDLSWIPELLEKCYDLGKKEVS